MSSKETEPNSSDHGDLLAIERGGETLKIQEAVGLFAVKRQSGATPGTLKAAEGNRAGFSGLRFQQAESSGEVEVYRVDAEDRDQAMEILRAEHADAEWCAHVYHLAGASGDLMIPTDRIYIELSQDSSPESINALLSEHGLEVMPANDEDDDAFVVRLTSESTQNPIKIADALRRHEEVKLAEPDFAMQARLSAYRPTDTLFPSQWHLENRGGTGLAAGADVKAPEAWDLTRGDRSIKVCVMDDGVQTSHPDFGSAGKIVAPRDFGQSDSDPNPVAKDDNHGTACAGVAVADENGSGVVGIAPGCALMPYRTSGMISDASIKALFDTARSDGADVISCSWGVNAKFFTLSTQMKKAISRAAVQGRGGRGCVVVFASGNENSPVNDPAQGKRSGFAIHPDVISVNASNSRDQRSHYSNFGSETWVCAPSSGSGGRRIVTTDRTGGAGYQGGDFTTVNGFGGTSSSCPLVAGICGLILSVNPELTAADVKEILRATSDKIDPNSGKYNDDGHSDLFGYGRANAFRAVKEALSRAAPKAVRRVTFESAAQIVITDFPHVGISDSIEVDDTATVRALEVTVDIEHTYRGDLIVEIVSPDGAVVKLHDRSGQSRDDLRTTYRSEDVLGLASLAGSSARGLWTLRVSDHARQDTGKLVSWNLMFDLEGGPRTEWRLEPGISIPDNNPAGIVSELEIDEVGALASIELTVDITHTYRGDLKVSLESPSGLGAQIHEQQGGGADDLKRTYSGRDTPSLAALVDAAGGIHGKWRLHVSDNLGQDLGKLNAWGLKLTTE